MLACIIDRKWANSCCAVSRRILMTDRPLLSFDFILGCRITNRTIWSGSIALLVCTPRACNFFIIFLIYMITVRVKVTQSTPMISCTTNVHRHLLVTSHSTIYPISEHTVVMRKALIQQIWTMNIFPTVLSRLISANVSKSGCIRYFL
jgi:hypothetical protein